jgi:hypothetical protein
MVRLLADEMGMIPRNPLSPLTPHCHGNQQPQITHHELCQIKYCIDLYVMMKMPTITNNARLRTKTGCISCAYLIRSPFPIKLLGSLFP